MALDPVPLYVVALVGGFKSLPQFRVLDRFFAGGAPAILLPFGNPAGDAIAQIVGISVSSAREYGLGED